MLKRTYCDACYRISYETHRGVYCASCADDAKQVRILYNRIISERPHLKRLGQAEVFGKLYESYKSKVKNR